MARNHAGQTTDSLLQVADKSRVSHVLRIAVAPDAVLCTDGSNILAAVAKALALEHQPVDVQSAVRVRGAWHTQNVNAYHGRFKEWMRRFKGASGPMQVIPATARETARHIGMTGFTADQINDTRTDMVIGTAYLKRALDDFGGSMALAAAAYNAGPGRPRSWRGQSGGPVMEGAIWAENVPSAETRDDVGKVLANTTNYAALLTGQPQSLKARLGSVGARGASAPPSDAKMP